MFCHGKRALQAHLPGILPSADPLKVIWVNRSGRQELVALDFRVFRNLFFKASMRLPK